MTTRPVSRTTRAILLTVCIAPGAVAVAATTDNDEPTTCLGSTLTFETSALERIVREPGRVLEDEDRFWEEEPAQKYTSVWAENNGFEISRRKWRGKLSRFAELSDEERRGSSLMRTTEAILGDREEFLSRALPHICSFLPESIDSGVPVYFTAFIPPRAFVTGGIVINVNASYWKQNADNILNTLTHEIWHVGYSRMRSGRTEPPLDHERLYGMLDQLQNEGTATYVAYQGRKQFPAPDELDFRALDEPEEVTRALNEVNELLGKVGTVSDERLGRLSWEVGVEGRAYYVAGAHMAATIDGASGREALIETLAAGPVSFVTAYNAVAPEDRRIEYPDTASLARQEDEPGIRPPIVLITVVLLGLVLLVLTVRKMAR